MTILKLVTLEVEVEANPDGGVRVWLPSKYGDIEITDAFDEIELGQFLEQLNQALEDFYRDE